MSYYPTLFTCSKCPTILLFLHVPSVLLSCPSFYAFQGSVLLSYFLQFATWKCFTVLLFTFSKCSTVLLFTRSKEVSSYCPTFYRLQLASVLLSYFLHVPNVLLSFFLRVPRKCPPTVLLLTGCSLQVFYCPTFYMFQTSYCPSFDAFQGSVLQ